MKALLDLKGWRKIEEIPDDAVYREWVSIKIPHPLDLMLRADEKRKVPKTKITIVDLYYKGVVDNLPFFEAL